MPIVSKTVLKGYFNDGDLPIESDYIDLIDTMGDMNKSVYDTDDDGKVNSALNSDQLGSVVAANYLQRTSANRPGVTRLFRRDDDNHYSLQTQWESPYWTLEGYFNDAYHAGVKVAYAAVAPWAGISGKPSTFPPSSHTHLGSEIVSTVSNADTVDDYHATDFYRDSANFSTQGFLNTSSYIHADSYLDSDSYVHADGDIYTVAYTSYTSTLTGCTTGTVVLYYKKIGSLVYLHIYIVKTKNGSAGVITITLPNNAAMGLELTFPLTCTENGTDRNSVGVIPSSSSTITIYPSAAGGTFPGNAELVIRGFVIYNA